MKNRTNRAVVVGLVCLANMLIALADVRVVILNPEQRVSPRGTVMFRARVENRGTSSVYLNGASAQINASRIVLDTLPFIQNAPEMLAPGESWTGDVLLARVEPGVLGGVATGAFEVIGGSSPNSFSLLASTEFYLEIVLPPGDTNRDGCVDDSDLLEILFNFGSEEAPWADVDNDGIVDDADLLVVLFNFGLGC